jgi:hypothetical protein
MAGTRADRGKLIHVADQDHARFGAILSMGWGKAEAIR